MSPVLEKARGATAFSRDDWYPNQEVHINGVYFVNQSSSSDEAVWSERIADLLTIQALNDDWDGDGSVAPEKAVVDGAIRLAEILQRQTEEPPDRIVAGVNGTIFFEWHISIGYREIEVLSPTTAEDRYLPQDSRETIVTAIGW